MPIDGLYADSTSSFLAGSNQVDVPTPQSTPSTSITSIARAVGRGIGQGGSSLFGAAADTASGLSQLYADPDSLAGNPDAVQRADAQVNDALSKARAGHLFESGVGSAAYDLADTLKPDPTKTTAIDQVVQGAVSGLTQIVPAAVLGGPLAGAAVGGTSMGMSRAEDLKRQGVDVGTRTAVGSLEGALGGAGAVMPLGGSTLLRTAGLVAAGGPGLTVAQGAAEKAILRNANYDHLADQIDPLDPTNLAASTLVAGAFGAVHAVGQVRADRVATAAGAVPTPAAPISAEPLTSMSVADRKALAFNSPSLDAYATQAAQAAGVPPEMLLFIKNKGEQSNSNQVSPKGAKGVMQFTDPTWAQFGKGDPTDPVNSIDAAAAYSADLLNRYDGDIRAALTEYNGGVKQAEAVHAGGAPTDPETIAYLRRYDQFSANHQISNASFTPTPEQVDASLLSTGQHLVDDAHLGPDTDIASMVAHQDAFELAARQMSDGEMPAVQDFISPDVRDSAQFQGFARDVGDTLAPERPLQAPDQQPTNIVDRPAPADVAEPVQRVAQATDDAATAVNGVANVARQQKSLSPVEANVREAAIADPTIPVHLDSSNPEMPEHNGTIESALELIDNEHAATLDDTKLFSVAANCFIGTVTGNA